MKHDISFDCIYIPCRTAMVEDNTNVLVNVYWGDDGTHMFIYENGVEKIDPFLYTFGKY
jgi:hypothetical protein